VSYRARYPLTSALLAALVLVHAVVWATGLAEPQPARLLVRLGASRHDLVLERGEWWRLLASAFLHLGPLHLAMNGLFLAQLGALCEERWGAARTLAVYLLAALGGGLLGAAARSPVPSVGASGAILGLAGLFLGATWFAPAPVREQLRRVYGQWLAASIALTFAVGLALQLGGHTILDNPGHAGGLLTGLLASVVLRDPGRPPGRASRAVAALLAALALASLVAA
jgi:rhomboid protease GluP